jgi:hypothetical protein
MSEHDDCRQALLDGEVNRAVTAHVETCADCGRLAARLERLEQASPMLLDVHPPPPGLADRVIERVGAEPARAAPPVVQLHRRVRRNLLLAATAAAVVVAVVATSIVVRDSGGEPGPQAGPQAGPEAGGRRVLLVAAENTAEQGSARVRLTADIDVELDTPLGGTGTYVVDGEGEIDFPDRLHQTYTISTTDDTDPILAIEPETTEQIVIDEQSWDRTPGAVWTLDDDSESGGTPLTRTLYRPEATLEVLRSADSDPVDLGIDNVDGERLHGYRFTVPAELFPALFEPREGPPGDHTVVVYVSEVDQVLRRMVVTSGGTTDDPAALTWRSEFTIELSDFGTPVAIEPPPADEVEE